MRINSVAAQAFGPLAGATLELAEGLTIVFGPNESAKSSWHAAIYAALCGRPSRVQGQEERLFEDRHRPWGGGAWLVEAELRLDDGRQIGVRQNLLNRADRKTFDLDLGRDVSSEIMNDGSPDAARWLGLDRRSFRATACIGQTQILDVMAGAGGLQAFLQRAAAGSGGGPPIEAITRIVDFHGLSVGNLRRLRSPLAMAQKRVDAAVEALSRARAVHAQSERLWIEVERARDAASLADERLGRAEWGAAATAAAQLAQRVRRAEEFEGQLSAFEPGGAPGADDVSAVVSAALLKWSVESGPDRSVPASAATPADDVDARQSAGPDGGAGPAGGAALASGGLSDAELWDLARDLEAAVPEPDPAAQARMDQARGALAAAGRAASRSRWLIAGGLLGALVGAGAMAAEATLAGGSLVAIGVAIVFIGLLMARGRGPARTELAAAERATAAEQSRIAQALATHSLAAARIRSAGLRPDPEELRAVARAREAERAVVERDRYWRERNRAEAEARTAEAAARVGAVAARIMALTDRLGLVATTADQAVSELRAWQERYRVDEIARREFAQQARERLASVLAGLTMTQLREGVEQAASEAAALRSGLREEVDGETLDSYLDRYRVRSGPDDRPVLRQLAREAGEARRAAEVALEAAMRDRGVPVGEAEEDLAAASAELARITELGQTLSLTQRFLEQAQERAHRTIAPRLNDSMRSQLPTVTGGRYTEVTVDPEDLAVTVRGPGGPPRPAHLLSFGTAEQVYLLLRIALAEHLVIESEACPLIFDDVTVHADPERTAAILDLLLAASARHQIIVFTQQTQVLEWARAHLGGDRHAIRELARVATV
jgi:exonuclease SbcC